MRAAVVICVGALVGCRGLLGIDDPQLAADSGLALDSPGMDAQLCFGPAVGQKICLGMLPTEDLEIGGAINTDTCTVKLQGYCLYAGLDVTIRDTQATGSAPLIILAIRRLQLVGSLDARGHGPVGGPGTADSLSCSSGSAPVSGLNGGGGGAGGSFQSKGGNGGGGDGGQHAGAMSGAALAAPVMVRAGCPGSRGGAGTVTSDAPGGAGGGVYLLAVEDMELRGDVNASGGGGGRGNASKSGGSGAGSGGMIVLWSPTVHGQVTLIANGGGGGGGADNGASGAAGSDGTSLTAAPGGNGGSALTGHGGAGAAGNSRGQDGTTDGTGAGGGGGGGGVGYIRLFGDTMTLIVSASPSVLTD